MNEHHAKTLEGLAASEDYVSDDDTIGAMMQFGGGFIAQLARLYRSADADNRARIQATWPEYWQQYTELAALRRTDNPQPDATGQP